MTREDFLYALENEGLIDCERDWININVEETIDRAEFDKWFWSRRGEWISLKVIYRILEEEWAFSD